MKKVLLYSVLLFFIACDSNPRLGCSDQNIKEISFLNDTISLKLPVSWNNIDSTRFYDKALIYSRNIMNKDTSCFAYIIASDYSVYPDVKLSEKLFFEKMKAKMREVTTGKEDSLLEDVTKVVNGYRINFLKYKQSGDKQVYNAHIGFILPLKKQVGITIRSTDINQSEAIKVIDCIFLSLRIK